MGAKDAPSQFYTGLIADLYEPLLSERAKAEDYVAFLERCGAPALELACGSGLPLLDLVERGFEVEGLDSSRDMLGRCRAAAAERDLTVTLHEGEMQSFELERRYRAIFLAGASFTLLTTDAEAAQALACMHAHLEPGGSVLIPLEIEDISLMKKVLGHVRETTTAAGDCLRVVITALDVSEDGRTLRHSMRYERTREAEAPEVVERVWQRRWWSQDQFREMLLTAGFETVAFVDPAGGLAAPDAAIFVALARRGET